MQFKAGLFKGVSKETVSSKSPFLNESPGRYILRVDNLSLSEDRKTILQLVADLTVVKTMHDGGVAGDPNSDKIPGTDPACRAFRAGTRVRVMAKRSNDYFIKDVAKIFHAITGLTPDELGRDEESAEVNLFMSLGISPDGTNSEPLFKGQFLSLEVEVKALEKKNEPGEYFNVTNWIGRVKGSELQTILNDEEKERFFVDAEGVDRIAHWVEVEEGGFDIGDVVRTLSDPAEEEEEEGE